MNLILRQLVDAVGLGDLMSGRFMAIKQAVAIPKARNQRDAEVAALVN